MLARPHPQEHDAGPHRDKGATERLCAATRTVRPIGELIRFVVAPDGAVVPDIKRKLPGRGVWVTASRATVDDAVRRNVFSRSFKAKLRVPADLGALVDRLLEQACLDALGITHKAGRVAIGFSKAESALARDPVVAMIAASDARADGMRKLEAAARHEFGDETGPVEVRALSSAQLDLALGRSNVIHAALLAGPASDGFIARYSCLERFRAIVPAASGSHAMLNREGAGSNRNAD